MLYKVIFIDDENSTIKLLGKIVDWNSFGFEVSGVASDGDEGLLLYDMVRPDLIVVDILMPVMNGIEVIKQIRDRDHLVKIIILSAHGEFEYAQKAMDYGVSQFMLKPLDEEILKKILLDIRLKLDLERTAHHSNGRIRHDLFDKNIEMSIRKWLNTREEEAQTEDGDLIWTLLCKQLPNLPFRIINLKANPNNGDTEGSSLSNLNDELRAWSERYFSHFVLVHYSLYRIILIVNIENDEQMGEALQSLFEHYDSRIDFSVGISHVFSEIKEMKQAYLQSVQATESCFYETGSSVLSFKDYPVFANRLLNENYGKEELAIKSWAQTGKRDELIQMLQQRVESMIQHRVSPNDVYTFFLQINVVIKKEVVHNYSDESLTISNTESLDSLKRFYRLNQLLDYMKVMINYISDKIKTLQGNDTHDGIVDKAKVYSEQHFRERDFSVQAVARHLSISEGYFLRLFKKTTGENYWNYVTDFRIREAKKLLRTTSKTSLEISEMVGYGSEYHFCRKFKEKVGLPPKKFRML